MAEDTPGDRLGAMVEKCLECKLCQKECEFLNKFGTPKRLAQAFDPSLREQRDMPFACSLCGLCESICPVGLSPGRMFLEMRRLCESSGTRNPYQSSSGPDFRPPRRSSRKDRGFQSAFHILESPVAEETFQKTSEGNGDA